MWFHPNSQPKIRPKSSLAALALASPFGLLNINTTWRHTKDLTFSWARKARPTYVPFIEASQSTRLNQANRAQLSKLHSKTIAHIACQLLADIGSAPLNKTIFSWIHVLSRNGSPCCMATCRMNSMFHCMQHRKLLRTISRPSLHQYMFVFTIQCMYLLCRRAQVPLFLCNFCVCESLCNKHKMGFRVARYIEQSCHMRTHSTWLWQWAWLEYVESRKHAVNVWVLLNQVPLLYFYT